MVHALRRAYKLGKGRWSYNRCSLILWQGGVNVSDTGGAALSLSVVKAVSRQSDGPDDQVRLPTSCAFITQYAAYVTTALRFASQGCYAAVNMLTRCPTNQQLQNSC